MHRDSPLGWGEAAPWFEARAPVNPRYATLPFLYDDEAARIRKANNRFLGDEVGAYKAEESMSHQASKAPRDRGNLAS